MAALQAGKTTSGRSGNVVYAAAPVDLSPLERERLHGFEGTLAILLTRDVGGLGPSWVYFTVAGAAALAVAALVAWQMSRRMSRPLVEAVDATARIAAGDLESRVPVRAHDYPEFSSLAGSINHMAQSLDDGRARERHLLLAVSHDLRTPLTSIRGFAEAIHDGAVEDEARAADVIIAESRRLERLVGDLLDLTKLEARQMSISLRPTDVGEVVSTTVGGLPALRRQVRTGARGARTRRASGRAASRGRPGPPGAAAGQPHGERVGVRSEFGHRRPRHRSGDRCVHHHGRRRWTRHRIRGPGAGLRALLPGRPRATAAKRALGSDSPSSPSWLQRWAARSEPCRLCILVAAHVSSSPCAGGRARGRHPSCATPSYDLNRGEATEEGQWRPGPGGAEPARCTVPFHVGCSGGHQEHTPVLRAVQEGRQAAGRRP